MGHAHHSHGPGSGEDLPIDPLVTRILAVAVAVLVVLTAFGLWTLWPRDPLPVSANNQLATIEYVNATVTEVTPASCGPVTMACNDVTVHIDSGPDEGQTVALPPMQVGGSVPALEVGDAIVVSRLVTLTTPDDAASYSYADLQRSRPMWLLALGFSVFVVLVARWRGVGALIGLGFTWLVLITFLIPAILTGTSPVAAGITASAVIMFVVLYLAHGVNVRTTTALLGTLVSLGLIGVLSWIFVSATSLTGLSSEEAVYIQNSGAITLDLSGLLLCSIIIGSLGVLNDVTVTQASAVWEIRAADPDRSWRSVYAAGMRVGRDHIASTVDTLVLAYAGASLPLLILFVLGNQQFSDVITSEIVAEEVVRTLVGSIGLVASVPLTTGLAALVVRGARGDDEPTEPQVPDLLE